MATDGICEFESAVDNGSHQIDTAARPLIFITRFHISRAGGGTKSAVNAVQEAIIGDGLAESRKRTGDRWLLVGHRSVPLFTRIIAMIGRVLGN